MERFPRAQLLPKPGPTGEDLTQDAYFQGHYSFSTGLRSKSS